jgi:hypothetical protein
VQGLKAIGFFLFYFFLYAGRDGADPSRFLIFGLALAIKTGKSVFHKVGQCKACGSDQFLQVLHTLTSRNSSESSLAQGDLYPNLTSFIRTLC